MLILIPVNKEKRFQPVKIEQTMNSEKPATGITKKIPSLDEINQYKVISNLKEASCFKSTKFRERVFLNTLKMPQVIDVHMEVH